MNEELKRREKIQLSKYCNMSIHIENKLKNNTYTEQHIHHVPCTIEENGPAKVSKYFEPTVKTDINGELLASLRGRALVGRHRTVPDAYCGALLAAPHRRCQVVGRFKEFINWNWDKKPSENDNMAKAMVWMEIAEAIHSD